MAVLCLALLILLSPLPLGSNRPLAEALLTITASLALMSWGWAGRLNLGWHRLMPVFLCFGTVWFWLVLSVFLSVDSGAALVSLMKFSTCFAVFALAVQYGTEAKLARRFLKLIAFSALVYALYGLAVYALGNASLLWFEKWAYADSLTGTFVNRNAFAAYAGMGLLACLSLLAQAASRENGNWRGLLRHATPTVWLALLGLFTLLIAVILSNSRAGLVSLGLGVLALLFGLWFSRSLPRRTLLLLALVIGITTAASIATLGDRLIERAQTGYFLQDDRPQTWRASLQMIAERPLTGWGPGTFGQMFLQFRTEATRQNYIRAHSTYLEMAATLGLPASILFFSGFGCIGIFLLRGQHIRRQNKIYPVFAFAVLVQAASHALVDFSFQIPANAVILSIILGIGMAQSFPGQQRETAPLQ